MRPAPKRCNEKGSTIGPSGAAPATSRSAVDSGKILFRLEKSPCRHRKASSNQWLETILASRPTAEIRRLLAQLAADRQWNSGAGLRLQNSAYQASAFN
jgi:hypothetical protein